MEKLLFQTKHYLQTNYITFNISYKSLTLQYSFTFTFLTNVREKKENRGESFIKAKQRTMYYWSLKKKKKKKKKKYIKKLENEHEIRHK